MSLTIIQGPVIAGMPKGYPRYWSRVGEKNTQKRAKPADLIRNPTNYGCSSVYTTTSPDYSRSGALRTPAYGSVGVSISSWPELITLQNSLVAQADNRVLKKIKGGVWNLGVFLGELPLTQKYLLTALPRIAELYLSWRNRFRNPRYWKSLVKRGKRFTKRQGQHGLVKGSKDTAKAWLEFRYAASPLVYDLDDMLKYLYTSALNPRIMRASGGASDRWVRVINGGKYSPSMSHAYGMQARTTVYYSVSPDAAAMKRLGLINLAAVLWELTPLSFVVDMVLPVGDFIGNFDAMVGCTVLSCTTSVRTVGEVTRPNFVENGYHYGGSKAKGDFYGRSVKGAPLNKPFFTKSPTGKQLCDLSALLRTIVIK